MARLLLFLILVALTFTSSARAQLLSGYGVKASVISAGAEGAFEGVGPSQNFSRRTGFGVALFAEWGRVDFFSLLTQVEYAHRGFVKEVSRTIRDGSSPTGYRNLGTIHVTDRSGYMSVPVMAKFHYAGNGLIRPFVALGPRVDVLLQNNDRVFLEKDQGQPARRFAPSWSSPQSLVWGGAASVGAAFDGFPGGALSIELRYNLDVTDASSSPNYTLKRNAFDLWVGMTF